jgi:hypothetical protein
MYSIYGTTDGEPKWFLEYTRGLLCLYAQCVAFKYFQNIIFKLTTLALLRQFYYNQGTKDLQPLKNGDVVRIQPSTQTNKEWKNGIVKSKVNIRSLDTGLSDHVWPFA